MSRKGRGVVGWSTVAQPLSGKDDISDEELKQWIGHDPACLFGGIASG